MTIYACSTNKGKLAEFSMAARESDIAGLILEPLPGLSQLTAPDESGSSFEENASQKAVYYSRFTAETVLADDSGLEVEALEGAPGIYSARYAGVDAVDRANNFLLLRNMEGVADRRARFVCWLALAREGRVLTTQRGTVEGTILTGPRGQGGFGYDPLFFYPPLNRTMAELTEQEKLAISHRGNALLALFAWIRSAGLAGL